MLSAVGTLSPSIQARAALRVTPIAFAKLVSVHGGGAGRSASPKNTAAFLIASLVTTPRIFAARVSSEQGALCFTLDSLVSAGVPVSAVPRTSWWPSLGLESCCQLGRGKSDMHTRPITSEDAPLVVARAGTQLTALGHSARAKLMMSSPNSQQRAKELLESAYRDDPKLARHRAVNVAARALAVQFTQFSPS